MTAPLKNKYYLYCCFALAVLWCALLWRATRPNREVTFVDHFRGGYNSIHVAPQQGGWRAGAGGLRLVPGQQGNRLYQFPKREHQRVYLSLKFLQPPGGTNRLHIHKSDPLGRGPSQDYILENKDFDFKGLDITDYVQGQGYFQIYLLASAPANANSTPLITKLAVRWSAEPKTIHWLSLLFFVSLSILTYAYILLILLPLAGKGLKVILENKRALEIYILSIVLVIWVTGSVFFHHEFWQSKSERFDDLSSIGVAALLHQDGYDPSEMVFRSRIRPALTAFLLPWTELLPQQLSGSTFTPSDKQQRMFFYYDRAGWSYGMRLYPEMSLFFALLMIVSLLAMTGMAHEAGASSIECLLLYLTSAWFIHRCLYNAISESANFAGTIAAAAVAWRAWQQPRWGNMFVAGLMMSIMVLLKETFVILALGLALYQLRMLIRKDSTPTGPVKKEDETLPICASCGGGFFSKCHKSIVFHKNKLFSALTKLAQTDDANLQNKHYWQWLVWICLFWGIAAILPLIYYGTILDTGFAELQANTALLKFHQELHHYESLTLRSGVRIYWHVFGLGLIFALLGLWGMIRSFRKWSESDWFFVCWFVGTLLTLTMPYIFERFLLFSIPPFAYLTVQGLRFIMPHVMRRLRLEGQY